MLKPLCGPSFNEELNFRVQRWEGGIAPTHRAGSPPMKSDKGLQFPKGCTPSSPGSATGAPVDMALPSAL